MFGIYWCNLVACIIGWYCCWLALLLGVEGEKGTLGQGIML